MRAFGLACAAAAAAAVMLPGHRLGVGMAIVAVTAAAAVAAARATTVSVHSLGFGGLALVLAAIPAVRDAGWVVAADLAGSLVLASIAVAGGTRWLELATGAVAALVRLFAAPRLIAEAELETAQLRGLAPVARGLVAGGLVVAPFGALFWSADRAFAELGDSLPFPSLASLPERAVVFTLVLFLVGGLVLAGRRPLSVTHRDRRPRLATAEWAIPLALLDLLFLAFVVVQLAVLFGGNEHVLSTAGLTYAEYARQGFAELLAAAGLTLVVVAVAARLATPGARLLLRALLGVLCLLTLVILASALRRLGLYEDAFGFTRLRIVAHATGLWLGGLFLLVLLAGVTHHSRWLPRTTVAFTGVSLLGFSLANPDGLVAERNVDRWRSTGKIDVAYARSLSADAVPALLRLPPSLGERALVDVRARLARDEPWSSVNVARSRARDALAQRG